MNVYVVLVPVLGMRPGLRTFKIGRAGDGVNWYIMRLVSLVG